MTLIDPALIEPLLLACIEKDPVNLQRVNNSHVKRAIRAINRATTTKPATVREPIMTKEFLAACHDLTDDAQREHLIVAYGYQYRKGTDLYAFHHVTGAERQVQIPDHVREEIQRHHAHRTDAEVIVFHNHPRTGQEPAWFYTLKALLSDLPIASSADRRVLEAHQFSPLGVIRQFLRQGQVHFYLGESGYVRQFSLPLLLTFLAQQQARTVRL